MKLSKDEMKVFYGSLLTMVFCLLAVAFFAPCCFGAELDVECVDLGYEYMTLEELESYDIKPENIELDKYFGSYKELKHRAEFCDMTGLDMSSTEFYQPDELSVEYLMSRTPEDRIVTVHISVCMDTENFMGCILNTTSYCDGTSFAIRQEPSGEIIGSTATIRDVVVSYLLYNPDNNEYDDFSVREDFTVDNLDLFDEEGVYTDGDY